jgi:hypothetical protein
MHSSKDGQPLPSGAKVFRLFKLSKDGAISEECFQLSTIDKSSPRKLFSVWESTCTTIPQALSFLQGDKEGYQKYAVLQVDAIRSIRPAPDVSEISPFLDVIWDRLFLPGTEIPDTRPGAQGHCGISGLARDELPSQYPTEKRYVKNLRKSLRSQLTDFANSNVCTVVR